MGRGRAPCCEKIGLKKGPWAPSEDMRLIAYIQNHGHGNWRALPKEAGLLRCGKSCRLRWINYLRPDVKRGNFTQEEEETIIKLHGLLGNKWSKIASHLPGRTDNEIKNVWNTHLKKRLAPKGSKLSSAKEPKESSVSSSSSTADSTLSSCNQSNGSKYEEPLDPELNLDKTHMGNREPSVELIEIPFEPNLDFWDMLVDESSKEDDTDQSRPSLTPSSSFSSISCTSNSHPCLDDRDSPSREGSPEHTEKERVITNNTNSDFWDMLREEELGCMDYVEIHRTGANEAGEVEGGEVDDKQWIADLEFELQMSPRCGESLQSLAKDAAEPQVYFPSSDGTLEFELDAIEAYFQTQQHCL